MIIAALALALCLQAEAGPATAPGAPAAAAGASEEPTPPAHADAPVPPPPPPLAEPVPPVAPEPELAPSPGAAPPPSPSDAAASSEAGDASSPSSPAPEPPAKADSAGDAAAVTLEVVNAKTGQAVLALADAPASVRLTLKPGKYRLRRVGSQGTVIGKAVLKEGLQVEVPEVGVLLVAEPGRSWESTDGGPAGSLTTLRAHTMEAQILPGLVHVFAARGTGRITLRVGLSWGLTDRLQLGLLNLAYRLGSHGSVEVVPYLRLLDASDLYDGEGLDNIGYEPAIDQRFAPSAGATLRGWLRRQWAINIGVEASMGVGLATRYGFRAFLYGWRAGASAGFTRIFLSRLVVNVGVGYGYTDLRVPSRPPVARHELVLGSAQSVGPRALPLMGVEVADWLTLETHLTVKLRPSEPGTNEMRLLAGAAITW